MFRLNRHNLGMLMAVGAIALGSALIGCGSDETPPQNEGGSGGAGGAGGSGGDGGGGGTGPAFCGGAICVEGETCVKARCECTPESETEEDSCTAANPDKYCSANRICVDKEPETEFSPCRVPGATSENGELVCDDAFSTYRWLRPCESSSECRIDYTVCRLGDDAEEGDSTFCLYNYCGDFNVDVDDSGNPILDGDGNPTYLNGENWGACDTEDGTVEEGETLNGTCLPLDAGAGPLFLCLNSGGLEGGADCRTDATRNQRSELCGQGLACAGTNLRRLACTSDDQCDPGMACTGQEGNQRFCDVVDCEEDSDCAGESYCHRTAGFCVGYGSCQERCNAGTTKEEGGPFAGCDLQPEVEQFCGMTFSNPNAPGWDHAQGLCIGVCDILEGGCEGLGGRAQVCTYAGNFSEPTRGLCFDASEERAQVGESCGPTIDCEDGLACVGGTCRAFCECGITRWDANGDCRDAAPQCSESELCQARVQGNPAVGLCWPND